MLKGSAFRGYGAKPTTTKSSDDDADNEDKCEEDASAYDLGFCDPTSHMSEIRSALGIAVKAKPKAKGSGPKAKAKAKGDTESLPPAILGTPPPPVTATPEQKGIVLDQEGQMLKRDLDLGLKAEREPSNLPTEVSESCLTSGE